MKLQKKGPEALSHYQVFHPSSGLWVFSGPGINLYLIAGETRAVLLDSGFGGAPGLREQAEALCGRSVDLFHTHAHGDHTGGDRAWTETWLHPGDWARYRQDHGDWGLTVHPLENGMVLDLGGRSLEVLHIPGHSPGSVALLDRQNRLLFPGDTVMTQPVFLHLPDSSVSDYRSSLARLSGLRDAFDRIYPSHRSFPLKADAIDALADCARQAEQGDPAGRREFSLDLMVAVERFAGYGCRGYAVTTQALSSTF